MRIARSLSTDPIHSPLRASFSISLLLAFASLAGCGAAPPTAEAASTVMPADAERSVFAGGCFWCMETAYEGQPGVLAVVSGYAGGEEVDPSYEEVSSGRTGHYEVVEVVWDPQTTSYQALLDVFWKNVDPTDGGGQFCDRGPQYRTAIFVDGDDQQRLAEASKQAAEATLGEPVVTPILPTQPFYPAEAYHQDFWKKSPVRYTSYRAGCGRDRRLEQLWGEAPH